MKVFDPLALSGLSSIFDGISAYHEHTTWEVSKSLKEDAATLANLGYRIVAEYPDQTIFLQKDDPAGNHSRIQLVPKGVATYETWCTETDDGFNVAIQRLNVHPDFEFVTPEFDHRYSKKYRHVLSGAIIQIVWRRNPMYPGNFPDEFLSGQ